MNDHLHALPPGHQLNEYRIDRVIGTGGFGITYYAWDTHLDKEVAIKEYLPNEFALRADGTTVKPKSTSDQENYQWGLERFLDEARTLARFDHPHLNKVSRFFEDNGTAYMVLEYIAGETLSQLLHREGRLDATRLQKLIDELLSGIEEVHQAGFAHRDIKPGNIMLREDGAAVLLDFGAARQAIGQRSKSITSVLTPGYAPIEQYFQKADRVGAWTDLYALGMVMYRCISGVSDSGLVDATERLDMEHSGELGNDLVPAVDVGKGRYDKSLLSTVDWAIKVKEGDRPQSVSAFREALAGGDMPTKAVDKKPASGAAKPPKHEKGKAGNGKRGALLWVLAAVAGLTVASVVVSPLIKESIYWSDVQCGEESDVRAYQEKYPTGRYEQEAGECLAAIETEEAQRTDDEAYAQAERTDTALAYGEYLRKYPAGRHTSTARERQQSRRKAEESQYWSGVQCSNVDQVQGYLRKHPDGRYEQEAGECLTAIETKAKAEAKVAAEARKFQDAVGRTASPRTVDDNGWTDLHYAAALDLPELARDLLKKGANVNARMKDDEEDWTAELREIANFARGWKRVGYTLLHIAAVKNTRDVAALLIDKGANIHAKDNLERTPLHDAAKKNSRDVAALLIEKGADIHAKDNNDGATPLHYAAANNAHDVAALLIEKRANIHAKSDSGYTPLYYAAYNNSPDVAALLIEKRANIHAKSDSGYTPLHSAAANNAHDVAALLIEKGANIHANSDSGWTPLHSAAWKNVHEVAALLIEKRADIHAKNNKGQTPLHTAAGYNSHDVAALLIEKGADINAKDNKGRTPLDDAKLKKAHEVIRLLE